MGSKSTYYSLAKDKLIGKHPRLYKLILIFTLLSLTGTAAFLISDILSFGIDYDKANLEAGDEKEPILSVLDANSSPSDVISSQPTANSTAKDEMSKGSREQNSSQNSSAVGNTGGSSSIAKKAGISTGISKSHSSSGSSSSLRSSSSSEKKVEKKADIGNNESANLTATNQTSGDHLPGNSSATLSASNDTASTIQQLNKMPAALYRNESPQIAVDESGDSDSPSERLMIEPGASGMAAEMKDQEDYQGSAEAVNAAEAEIQAETETPEKIETAVKEKTNAKAETSPQPETAANTESPDDAGRPISAEARVEIEAPVKTIASTEMTSNAETIARDNRPDRSAEEEGRISTKANERQEMRSKQIAELARKKAEHNEAEAIERAQSYSSIEKERAEKSESARKSSLMASQRSIDLQESRSDWGEDTARERIERNDAAMSAKALAEPSISRESKRATLSSTTASEIQRDELSDTGLGLASAESSPTVQEEKDAASLSKPSASVSSVQAQRGLKSSRSDLSEKIADLRSDRNDAAAASKASAFNLRAQAQSERMKAKEMASDRAHYAANARSERLQESRSRKTS